MHRSVSLALALTFLLGAVAATAQPLRVLAYRTDGFFYTEADGDPAGFEHDLLAYFAKKKGRDLEIRWADSFEEILESLRQGRADVAAATVTITPERQAVMGFSDSYFPVRIMLVERAGSATERLADLRGKRLATIPGTTLEKVLQAVPEGRMVYVEGQKELFEAVAGGRADAMAVDSAVAFLLLPEYRGLRLGIPLSEQQGYGFAVPKGSPLARELSEHVRQLKEGGIYYRLLEQYLGAEAVRTVRAAKQ